MNSKELQPLNKNDDWFNDLWLKESAEDANLLADAVMKQGVNTVGSTLKNANLDIRGWIITPKIVVWPWNQWSIDPDLNLKQLFVN